MQNIPVFEVAPDILLNEGVLHEHPIYDGPYSYLNRVADELVRSKEPVFSLIGKEKLLSIGAGIREILESGQIINDKGEISILTSELTSEQRRIIVESTPQFSSKKDLPPAENRDLPFSIGYGTAIKCGLLEIESQETPETFEKKARNVKERFFLTDPAQMAKLSYKITENGGTLFMFVERNEFGDIENERSNIAMLGVFINALKHYTLLQLDKDYMNKTRSYTKILPKILTLVSACLVDFVNMPGKIVCLVDDRVDKTRLWGISLLPLPGE